MLISTIFKARETVAKENNDSELIELPTQRFVILKAVLYVDQFHICLFRCKEGDWGFFLMEAVTQLRKMKGRVL